MSCSVSVFGFLIFCTWLGGPVAFCIFLAPYVMKIKPLWGIPRFYNSDFLSLAILLAAPLGLVARAPANLPRTQILIVAWGLVFCLTFLWIRLLWLLQQLDVHQAMRRITFTAAIFPLLCLDGALWAMYILTGFGMGLGSFEAFIVINATFFGGALFCSWKLRTLLAYVFSDSMSAGHRSKTFPAASTCSRPTNPISLPD